MKKILLAIFLLISSASAPAIASEFNSFIQEAISDLRAVKNLDNNIPVDEIIISLNKMLGQEAMSLGNSVNTTKPRALKADADTSLENLILISLPVSSIIIALLFCSFINKPRQSNQQRVLALQNVKQAAIDFSVTDEELLNLRNAAKHMPTYLS